MKRLESVTRKKILIPHLEVADHFWPRARGLLGRSQLPADQGLWILDCLSIHTFFMKFPIDCVFLDRNQKVSHLVNSVQPGRVVWPRWGASSVVELAEGVIEELQIQVGEQLHVGT